MVNENWFDDYFKLYRASFSGDYLNKKLLDLKNRLVEVNNLGVSQADSKCCISNLPAPCRRYSGWMYSMDTKPCS